MNSTLLLAFIPTFFFCFHHTRHVHDLSPHFGNEYWLPTNIMDDDWRTGWCCRGFGRSSTRNRFYHAKLSMAVHVIQNGWRTLPRLSRRSKGKLALSNEQQPTKVGKDWDLIVQGFVTAIANPKGWAFMISLLPPFIDSDAPLTPQLLLLVSIILLSEFICMTLYATGGRSLKRVLGHSENVRLLNRVSGTLMIGVGIWLLVS